MRWLYLRKGFWLGEGEFLPGRSGMKKNWKSSIAAMMAGLMLLGAAEGIHPLPQIRAG